MRYYLVLAFRSATTFLKSSRDLSDSRSGSRTMWATSLYPFSTACRKQFDGPAGVAIGQLLVRPAAVADRAWMHAAS